jgi:hypothetical protein
LVRAGELLRRRKAALETARRTGRSLSQSSRSQLRRGCSHRLRWSRRQTSAFARVGIGAGFKCSLDEAAVSSRHSRFGSFLRVKPLLRLPFVAERLCA